MNPNGAFRGKVRPPRFETETRFSSGSAFVTLSMPKPNLNWGWNGDGRAGQRQAVLFGYHPARNTGRFLRGKAGNQHEHCHAGGETPRRVRHEFTSTADLPVSHLVRVV